MTPAGKPPNTLTQIHIVAEPGANQNTATAIDIVFHYDGATTGMLPKSGPEWFAKKAEMINGLGQKTDIVTLLIQPAMMIDVPLPARHRKATAVYSYANYLSPYGQARHNLTDLRSVTIQLGQNTVTCISGK